VIAENVPNWELVAIAEEIENLDETLKALEGLGLVDPSEHNTLRDLVRSHRGFERVKLSNLTDEQAATFAVRRHRFPGVDIQEALVRRYPFGEASAHAVGYVGSISLADLERIDRSDYAATSQIGKQGVERAYEATLHGRVGYRQQVVNAQGRVLFDPANDRDPKKGIAALVGGMETKAPVPGNNVWLSLDMRLQLAAQEALGDFRGAVVAIDPRNGDVLALVSTPSFDPNRFAAGMSRGDYVALNTDPDKPLFNRALTGVYPPGSTVKPFIGLTALLHESIDPAKTL
jgi:penicillin-binding protein 2